MCQDRDVYRDPLPRCSRCEIPVSVGRAYCSTCKEALGLTAPLPTHACEGCGWSTTADGPLCPRCELTEMARR